jgi:hypothetical protein
MIHGGVSERLGATRTHRHHGASCCFDTHSSIIIHDKRWSTSKLWKIGIELLRVSGQSPTSARVPYATPSLGLEAILSGLKRPRGCPRWGTSCLRISPTRVMAQVDSGARSEDTVHSSLVDVQNKKKAEQAVQLARYPEWHLQHPVPSGVTDVTGLAQAELSHKEQEIVVQDAVSLQHAFAERRYTAVQVAKAFCHAATVAHQLTNCLTEIFYHEGLARAEELDRIYQETGRLVGPLHGVPVSIKDHIMVRGHHTSSGYAGWAFTAVAEKDAVVVQVLRQAGAILYVKTANPQTLLVGRPCVSRSPRNLQSCVVTGN